MNTLFVVEGENDETLIPAQEEFIVNIDHENKEIIFELPEGLVSM
jgi:16S rRNA processing protein RimM